MQVWSAFSFLLLLATSEAALWDTRGNRILSTNPSLTHWQEVNWPYLNDTADPRFRGVFTYMTPRSGYCLGVLIKTWDGDRPNTTALNNAFATAITSGICMRDQMSSGSAEAPLVGVRFPIAGTPYTGANPTALINFWRFANQTGNVPFPSYNLSIRAIPFTAVRGVDLSVLQLNHTIGTLLDRGFQFYDIADTDENLIGKPITCITINSVEPLPINYFRKSEGGVYLSRGQVSIQAGFVQNYEAIRVRYVNWQASGSPLFIGGPGETPKVFGMSYAYRTNENVASRLDLFKPCFNRTSQAFNFNLPTCLLNFRYNYAFNYGTKLPGTAVYDAQMVGYNPPFDIDAPSAEWPELPVDTDLETNWRANFTFSG